MPCGMSGSPVFVKPGKARYVIGIHTFGEPTIGPARYLSGYAHALLKEGGDYRWEAG